MFSDGQRQRIAIARVMSIPALVAAKESVFLPP